MEVKNDDQASGGVDGTAPPKSQDEPPAEAQPEAGSSSSNGQESSESSSLKSKPLRLADKKPSLRPQSKLGLSNRLTALRPKKKESVLSRSKTDWERLKQDEGLVEELSEHLKSRESFVERQAFLQRADVRQFEQEKSVRDIIRSKRLP